MPYGRYRRQAWRQHPPGQAAAQQIQDRLDNPSERPFARPPDMRSGCCSGSDGAWSGSEPTGQHSPGLPLRVRSHNPAGPSIPEGSWLARMIARKPESRWRLRWPTKWRGHLGHADKAAGLQSSGNGNRSLIERLRKAGTGKGEQENARRMRNMIEQIWVRKTSLESRASSSRIRCGPDPRITIPASGFCKMPQIQALRRPLLINRPQTQIFLTQGRQPQKSTHSSVRIQRLRRFATDLAGGSPQPCKGR